MGPGGPGAAGPGKEAPGGGPDRPADPVDDAAQSPDARFLQPVQGAADGAQESEVRTFIKEIRRYAAIEELEESVNRLLLIISQETEVIT